MNTQELIHIARTLVAGDQCGLAIDIAQSQIEQVVHIENTPMFFQTAEGFVIRSIPHTNHRSTYPREIGYVRIGDKWSDHP